MTRCIACSRRVRFWQRRVFVLSVGTFHRDCRVIWNRLSALLERHADGILKTRGLPSLKEMSSQKQKRSEKQKPLEM